MPDAQRGARSRTATRHDITDPADPLFPAAGDRGRLRHGRREVGEFRDPGRLPHLTGHAVKSSSGLNRVAFDWREEECPVQITVVGPDDLPELLPLMRAYCDFYEVAPSDQALRELSQALLVDPQREGLQLLARDDTGRAVGFATLFWTWQTLAAARVGVMNDLYVAAEARGSGVADGLIAACLERCREHGATQLVWQTAVDNHRAQAVYERIGATRDDRWLDYELPVDAGRGA
jgi:GNAT superfamily N-acetyltransferase